MPKIYPPHAKIFEKRLRLSKAGRRNVGATPTVQGYAHGFRARGLRGLNLVQAIVKDVQGFRKVALPTKEAKEQWAKRSADEIIGSRTVYINKRLAIAGCAERAVAIVASLRVLGFRAAIVTANCHTYAKLWHNNKVWIINTLATEGPGIREMNPEDIERENNYRQAKTIREAPSMPQAGATDYRKHFFKNRQKKNALGA